jgi:23S rRNA (adenine2503-C2)-methyltransferase
MALQGALVWGLSPQELTLAGVPRAAHCFKQLHRPWTWDSQGPLLGREHRTALAGFNLGLPEVSHLVTSPDGTTKLGLRYADGGLVEAVHMPREVSTGRVSICLSSQLGCAMGCLFCATAAGGLQRSLSAAEVVAQLLVVLRRLGPKQPSALSLVFMGMGEPLHNLDAVLQATKLLCEVDGLGLSPRRITISTSGLVPQLAQLAQLPAPRPRLAVSINATVDHTRRQLMPVPGRYSLDRLFEALAHYPLEPGEHLTIQYVLLAGINDSPEDARRLGQRCATLRCNINLIPHNPSPTLPFCAPTEGSLSQFARELLATGCRLVTIRRSRGSAAAGACGQLRATSNETPSRR